MKRTFFLICVMIFSYGCQNPVGDNDSNKMTNDDSKNIKLSSIIGTWYNIDFIDYEDSSKYDLVFFENGTFYIEYGTYFLQGFRDWGIYSFIESEKKGFISGYPINNPYSFSFSIENDSLKIKPSYYGDASTVFRGGIYLKKNK